MKHRIWLGILFVSATAGAADCDFSSLKTAAMTDHVSKVQILSASCGGPSNQVDPSGRTLLFTAVEFDAENVVAWLLAEKARADVADHQGITPLHLARTVTIAKALIRAGADVNAEDQWRRTPFQAMLEQGNTELLDQARLAGARIRARDLEWASDYYKMEALEYMAERAHRGELAGTGKYFRFFFFHEDRYQTLAAKLIEKGADLNQARTISSQKGLLEFYLDEYVKDGAGFVKNGLKALEFVAGHGADVNALTGPAGEPVAHAVLKKKDTRKNIEVLDILLKNGLDLNRANPAAGGQTLLMKLAIHIQATAEEERFVTDMGRFLLARGADPAAQSSEGRTALHWAVRWGNAPLVNLLAPVSDLSIRDHEGRTALEYAYARLAEVPSIGEKRVLAGIIRVLEGR